MQTNKHYAVVLYVDMYDMGIVPTSLKTRFHNCGVRYFKDKKSALDFYANYPCPASQFIEADTEEELQEKIKEMDRNFENEEWIETEILPYL